MCGDGHFVSKHDAWALLHIGVRVACIGHTTSITDFLLMVVCAQSQCNFTNIYALYLLIELQQRRASRRDKIEISP